jgi:hypothetical protein
MRLTRRKATFVGGAAAVLLATLLGAGGGTVAAAGAPGGQSMSQGSGEDPACGVTYAEYSQRPPDCDSM